VSTMAANLFGVVTDDGLPLGGAVTQSWSLVSGAGTPTFADASAAATSVSFDVDGDYVLRLNATDGAAVAFDDVLVRVNPINQPPVVDAGADQLITTVGTTLSASVAATNAPQAAPISALVPLKRAMAYLPPAMVVSPAPGISTLRGSSTHAS